MAPDAVVHLIDDDEAVRHALAFLLTGAGFAVRAYDSARAFLDSVAGVQPGCIVTDVRMPGMSGLELQSRLQESGVCLPVIVMTGHGDVPLAVAAMKAGAIDFLEKPFNDAVLIAAIRKAVRQYSVQAGRDEAGAAIQARLKLLSPREVEVLEGLVAGQQNKAIAYALKISARTVEVHRARVMDKMGAANLSDLVRMVFLVRGAG
jgi:two-component system, LuxR family, response regulator FixJ